MKIKELIESLPEVYQPIFGYKEYDVTSRNCLDRLEKVRKIICSLEEKLGNDKRLKILDLGCAQGFFSLSLADLGHKVTGVDFLEENIHVCKYLAGEHSQYDIEFIQADAVEYINGIEGNQFDIVLGFSLFHHLIAERGLFFVQDLLGNLAKKTKFAFYELAVKEEPVYWSEALPEDERQVLDKYSFTKLISKFETHLSNICRPMYFASNYYTLDNNVVDHFNKFLIQSHSFEYGAHCSSRRYFLSENYIMKVFEKKRLDSLNVNVIELLNEKEKLEYLNENGFDNLKLISYEEDSNRMYLKRTIYHGELLSDIIDNLSSDEKWSVFDNVLKDLLELEKLGLYTNDLRPWNVIVSDDFEARLIDYGSISNEMKDCSNPSSIFASFVLFVIELFSGKVSEPDPVRTFKSNLEDVPKSICYALDKNLINYDSKNLFFNIIKDVKEELLENRTEKVNELNGLLYYFISEIKNISMSYQYCFRNIDNRCVQLERNNNELVAQLSMLKYELDSTKNKVIELKFLNNIERENSEKFSNELNIFKERKAIRFIDFIVHLFRNS
jgi:O-antigen chain-terminating bifunctional methyltransferase/kinase